MNRPNEILLRVLFGLLPAMTLSGCGQFPSYSHVPLFDVDNPEFENLADQTSQTHTAREIDEEAAASFAAARKLEKNGDTEAALKEYLRLTREFPDDAAAFHRVGVLHDKNGRSDKSARFYLAAIQLAPQNAAIRCDYGYSRYLQGDFAVAERALREAIRLDAGLTRAHNNLALVLARQGKDEEAVASFQNAGFPQEAARRNLRHAQRAARLSAANSQPASGAK